MKVFLLFFAATLAILWPLLLGGKVFADQMYFFDQYPRFAFIERALTEDSSVLWSSNLLGGFPVFVGGWGENVHPAFLFLFEHFNFISAFHWLTFFNFVLGGFFMFLLARALGLSQPASLVTASIYSFSHLALGLGQFSFFSNLFPIIPLLFLSALGLAAGRRRYFWLIAALTALGWLGGFTELFLYILLAVFFFVVFLNFRSTGYFVLAVVLGAVPALPRLLPTFDFIDLTARRQGIFGPGFMKLGDLVEIVYPYFKVPFTSFLPIDLGTSTDLYFGILPLLLVITFFIGARKIFAANPAAKYFATVFVFTFLMLIEYVSPYHLLNRLPMLHWFRGSGKAFPLGMFSLAVMAGFGLDYISLVKEKPAFARFVKMAKYLVIIILFLALAVNFIFMFLHDQVIALANQYFEKNLYFQQTTQRPLEHYHDLIIKSFDRVSENLSLANFHFVFSLFFLAGSFLLFYFYHRGRLSTERFRKWAVILVIANFVVLWQGLFSLAPRVALTEIGQTARFIKQDEQNKKLPSRVFRFWAGISKYVDLGWDDTDSAGRLQLESELLSPNLSLLYGISFLSGHENIMSGRQAKTLAFVGAERMPNQANWISEPTPFNDKLARFQSLPNRHLLSMMGVRYLLTSFEFDEPWQKVFTTKVTSANIPVYVYENPEVLPRVYLANQVKFIENKEGSAFSELLANPDFKKTTLIECLKPECVYALHRPDPTDKVVIKEVESGYLKVITQTKYPRWLVYSESNLPYWEITIDGQPGRAFTANYLFQAIYVPPGENEVVFEYPGIWRQTKYALKNQISRLVK